MRWDGSVLRGPIFLWFQAELEPLPLGPPESGPFSRGKWSLGVWDNQACDKIQLRHRGVAIDQGVVIKLALVPRAGIMGTGVGRVEAPRTILPFTDLNVFNVKIPIAKELIDSHRRSASTFEMSVTCLTEKDKQSPSPAVANYVRGKQTFQSARTSLPTVLRPAMILQSLLSLLCHSTFDSASHSRARIFGQSRTFSESRPPTSRISSTQASQNL